MSTDCVFDPKLNIVAVDPDSNSVIQIPGTEFQAQVSSDSYERIALYPNYNPALADSGWGGTDKPPVAGVYCLGVGIENRNRYGVPWNTSVRSCMFRIAHPHIITPGGYNDLAAYLVESHYDKYIQYTDFVTHESLYQDQFERGFIRFNWQRMLDDSLALPKYAVLSFNVEIYRAWDPEPVVMEREQKYGLPVQSGPYHAPIIIPVRTHIVELQEAGRP